MIHSPFLIDWVSIGILTAVLGTIGYRQFYAVAGAPLPPGPTRLPLIGNTLQVAGRDRMEEVFAALSRKYGTIYVPMITRFSP